MPSLTITRFKHTRQPADRPDSSSAWGVLKHRDFRLFWLGQAVSGVGTFMQVVGQSLLVLELSHNSALALGLVSLAQAIAFFAFALIGGSVVDRVNRRALLFVTQTLLLGVALALAILSATGSASLPLVILLAFCSGMIVSFDQPARASIFPSLVPPEEVARATALNALAMTSAATVGPALAGLTAATLGLSVNFALNALSFVIALSCLALMQTTVSLPNAQAKQPLLSSVREGLAVVGHDPTLLRVVAGYAVLLLLGPSPSVLLPLYAAQVLHVGAAQLGGLFLMVGAGALLASAVQAALSGHECQRGVFVIGLIVWAFALAVFALSSSLVLSAIALLVHGAARNVVGTTAVTMMQLLAPKRARGRVMSLNTLLNGGLRPLGDFGLSAAMMVSSVAGVTLVCAGLIESGAMNPSEAASSRFRPHQASHPIKEIQMNLIQQTASLTDVPPRAAATIAGLGLLAMVVLAPFANFYVLDKLVVANDAKATADNIVAASGLFQTGIACFLVVAVLDVIVAWALHVLLEPVSKHLSLLAALFRVAYAAVFVSALVPLLGVVRLLSGGGRSAGLEGDQLHSQVTWALGAFHAGWGLGLVLFGVHLLALGAVLFKSSLVPKWLAVLVIIAGAGYLVDGFVDVLMPDVNFKLALFTFVGEVLLIFWLLWHGLKGSDQHRSQSRSQPIT